MTTTSPLRAIETHYAGCRFRSRTEARWAVAFDHLGLDWHYEEQGYELPSGDRYLPDFAIRGMGWPQELLIEVKGEVQPHELVLMGRCAQATRKPVMLLRDIPRPTWMPLFPLIVPDAARGIDEVMLSMSSFFKVGDTMNLAHINTGPPVFCDPKHLDVFGNEAGELPDGSLAGFIQPTYLADAYKAACSARFEHGQAPVPTRHPWPAQTDSHPFDLPVGDQR